jgi:hypothetical protein
MIGDTSWIVGKVAFEDFGDNPQPTPIAAAKHYIENCDDTDTHCDDLDELTNTGRLPLLIAECVETADPLPEGEGFDGYEPGVPYFRHTGRTVKVVVEISYRQEDA